MDRGSSDRLSNSISEWVKNFFALKAQSNQKYRYAQPLLKTWIQNQRFHYLEWKLHKRGPFAKTRGVLLESIDFDSWISDHSGTLNNQTVNCRVPVLDLNRFSQKSVPGLESEQVHFESDYISCEQYIQESPKKRSVAIKLLYSPVSCETCCPPLVHKRPKISHGAIYFWPKLQSPETDYSHKYQLGKRPSNS